MIVFLFLVVVLFFSGRAMRELPAAPSHTTPPKVEMGQSAPHRMWYDPWGASTRVTRGSSRWDSGLLRLIVEPYADPVHAPDNVVDRVGSGLGATVGRHQ